MSSAEHEKTTPLPVAGPSPAAPSTPAPGPSPTAGAAAPAAETTAPAPAAPGATPSPTEGPRTSTIVGALILILLGAGVLAVGLGALLDLQVALIVLLVVSGTALLVGALVGARRGR